MPTRCQHCNRMNKHNHVAGGDHTQHPEFAIARWVANNMTPELPIQDVIRDTTVDGPDPEPAERVHSLHQQFYARRR